jgi:DNA polymerase I
VILAHFTQAWAVDFEFKAEPGERPVPICLVARELHSGRLIRLWRDDMRREPPYPTAPDALFVAYYASAELGCHAALGWPMPARILDLFAEFRCATNGLPTPNGAGLLGALTYHGLDAIGATEKAEMRDLILHGGAWTERERAAILDYCQSDVDALARLLPVMSPSIDLPRALVRGRYMAAVARMEHAGVPVDVSMLDRLRGNWDGIKDQLIAAVDADYGVFDGRTLRVERFARWLAKTGIPWPRLPSGQLCLHDDTFRQAARAHPAVAPLRELRVSLAGMRLADLAVGRDERNRTLLSPFRARTGRNQPSNSKFIFGPSAWLRGLIKPPPGHGVAYLDYKQQEFGIAAALSDDTAMQEAYRSGDPYLAFAKQAGAVPQDATKATHGPVREQFKACALGVLFGMQSESLATAIEQSPARARVLLRLHHELYPDFWRWSQGAVDTAMLHGELRTTLGWTVRAGPLVNPRALQNFPAQGNGAEMLRLACCLGTEAGIEICAPVHDAVLIGAPLDALDAAIAEMKAKMAEASRVILSGFEIGVDAAIVRYPERYADPRGRVMWERVTRLLGYGDSDSNTGERINNKDPFRMGAVVLPHPCGRWRGAQMAHELLDPADWVCAETVRAAPKFEEPSERLFVKGPIPWSVVAKAAAAHSVGLILLLRIKMALDMSDRRLVKDGFVKVTKALCRNIPGSSDTRLRAIAALEKAGLVEVTRRRRSGTLVRPVKGLFPSAG